MAFDTNNTFTLGANNKGDNPKRPDFRGELIMGGKTYLLSAWWKDNTTRGTKFLSGRVQLKEEKRPTPPPEASVPPPAQQTGGDPVF